jgi:hypothetical protein
MRVKGSSTATRMCDKLSKVTSFIKHKTNEAVGLLQSYQTSIKQSQKLKTLPSMGGSNIYQKPIYQNNNSVDDYKSFSKDDYKESFGQANRFNPLNNISSMADYMSFQQDEFKDAVSKNNSIHNPPSFYAPSFTSIEGVQPFANHNLTNMSLFHSFVSGNQMPAFNSFGFAAGTNGVSDPNNYKMVIISLCSNSLRPIQYFDKSIQDAFLKTLSELVCH